MKKFLIWLGITILVAVLWGENFMWLSIGCGIVYVWHLDKQDKTI